MEANRIEIKHKQERLCSYCVECGKRLKANSYDLVHKQCLMFFEEDDNEPKYDRATGKALN